MMVGFFTPLFLMTSQGVEEYTLVQDISYHHSSELILKVPAGFKTNFANVPRILWPLISFDDVGIREASIIHDYLYSIECPLNIGRKESDIIFMDGMRDLGSSSLTILMVYITIRIFGHNYWKKT